ncbi:MAG: bifunctional aspartate kinase/homoserine dehydrogenase I [Treponema sp.]|jgi:aspartokinase/homoserine dehydrogenase 1|nr:bifunctional aspartate kinase/homoserine dehydrogenase I [Treponema sp.]
MRIIKFGGTSVGAPNAIRNGIAILKNKEHAGTMRMVVVSALSGVTDALIDMARKACAGHEGYKPAADALRGRHRDIIAPFLSGTQLTGALFIIDKLWAELEKILEGVAALGELSPRTLDTAMSFGERLSAALLAEIFTAHGIDAAYLDARPLVKTDDHFGGARFLERETFDNIRTYFKNSSLRPDAVHVATGFIGSTMSGVTTTLGRGGSDLSAAVFAAALEAETVEIWTDVDGILTADPRLVKDAFRIEEISYAEAMELSHFGAKVIYPPTMRPALIKGIPIRILNTFNPDNPGTWIKNNAKAGIYPIRGISSMNKAALVRVQGAGMVGVTGFSARLFDALARKKVNIILITQSSSEYSICFAVLPKDIEAAEAAIKEEFAREMELNVIEPVETTRDLAVIAVVGAQMRKTSGCAGKFFHALGRNGVNVIAIAQGSSELNISAVISARDEVKALNAVHEAFFLSGIRSVNLFLVGIGLIGGTLLEQLASHRETLAAEHKIRINVAGVADSKNMLLHVEGLDPGQVKAILKGDAPVGEQVAAAPFDMEVFVKLMKAMNLPNTAFCDCTASDTVAAKYTAILKASIPIVTPNKRANSGSLDYYKEITGYARARGIPYLYETTVCAGLPVISTLRDLFLSGDHVRRIEAVLSGTLSYIFNNFDGGTTFSALVREAKAKGYTEPDPRDDLNAMDAARKALVLARECGMPLEFSAVSIEPILPASCFGAATVDVFFAELEKADAGFERRRVAAEAEGKALRYVAVIENNAASISIRAESKDSPFRSLTDADNIVVITTDRYSTLPMVIKGPGAGAQVTAGGVFADIVRIAKTLV